MKMGAGRMASVFVLAFLCMSADLGGVAQAAAIGRSLTPEVSVVLATDDAPAQPLAPAVAQHAAPEPRSSSANDRLKVAQARAELLNLGYSPENMAFLEDAGWQHKELVSMFPVFNQPVAGQWLLDNLAMERGVLENIRKVVKYFGPSSTAVKEMIVGLSKYSRYGHLVEDSNQTELTMYGKLSFLYIQHTVGKPFLDLQDEPDFTNWCDEESKFDIMRLRSMIKLPSSCKGDLMVAGQAQSPACLQALSLVQAETSSNEFIAKHPSLMYWQYLLTILMMVGIVFGLIRFIQTISKHRSPEDAGSESERDALQCLLAAMEEQKKNKAGAITREELADSFCPMDKTCVVDCEHDCEHLTAARSYPDGTVVCTEPSVAMCGLVRKRGKPMYFCPSSMMCVDDCSDCDGMERNPWSVNEKSQTWVWSAKWEDLQEGQSRPTWEKKNRGPRKRPTEACQDSSQYCMMPTEQDLARHNIESITEYDTSIFSGSMKVTVTCRKHSRWTTPENKAYHEGNDLAGVNPCVKSCYDTDTHAKTHNAYELAGCCTLCGNTHSKKNRPNPMGPHDQDVEAIVSQYGSDASQYGDLKLECDIPGKDSSTVSASKAPAYVCVKPNQYENGNECDPSGPTTHEDNDPQTCVDCEEQAGCALQKEYTLNPPGITAATCEHVDGEKYKLPINWDSATMPGELPTGDSIEYTQLKDFVCLKHRHDPNGECSGCYDPMSRSRHSHNSQYWYPEGDVVKPDACLEKLKLYFAKKDRKCICKVPTRGYCLVGWGVAEACVGQDGCSVDGKACLGATADDFSKVGSRFKECDTREDTHAELTSVVFPVDSNTDYRAVLPSPEPHAELTTEPLTRDVDRLKLVVEGGIQGELIKCVRQLSCKVAETKCSRAHSGDSLFLACKAAHPGYCVDSNSELVQACTGGGYKCPGMQNDKHCRDIANKCGDDEYMPEYKDETSTAFDKTKHNYDHLQPYPRTECLRCPPAPGGTIVAVTVPAGVTLNVGCECAQGYYKQGPLGDLKCEPCPAGKFGYKKDAVGLSDCKSCTSADSEQKKMFQNEVGQSACKTCGDTGGGGENEGGHGVNAERTMCDPCAEGTYAPPKAYECRPCEQGSFTNADTGSSECKGCGAGTYSDITGISQQTACKLCEKGSYTSADTGSSECKGCGAGTYSDITGISQQTACKLCEKGSYTSAETGSIKCKGCAKGTYSDTKLGWYKGTDISKESDCKECEAGSYTNAKGTSECQKCGLDTYSDQKGQTQCTRCVGTVTSDGKGCIPPPPPTTT